jgi:Mn-dependent DtxR family transcriptional regulator
MERGAMSGKTNYFGTFLDTLNAPRRTAGTAGRSAPDLDTVLKIWPAAQKAKMSAADVAKALGISVTAAADALIKLERAGLAANKAGAFLLTPAGVEAATLVKAR